jgi:hypothetical protein
MEEVEDGIALFGFIIIARRQVDEGRLPAGIAEQIPG